PCPVLPCLPPDLPMTPHISHQISHSSPLTPRPRLAPARGFASPLTPTFCGGPLALSDATREGRGEGGTTPPQIARPAAYSIARNTRSASAARRARPAR